jgi:mannose-6-phosphate isomerase-like protein (cupin superfamily)
VTQASKPEILNIVQHSARLTEPFTMIDLARIDDLVLSIFLCQGAMPHHRHLDQDELFLVHSGMISLDSEWGNLILRPGELAVVPKGVGHRSSSPLRSLVLLLQPRLVVDRRNGHRRLFVLKDEDRLEKVSLPALGSHIAVPFNPVLVTRLDTFAVHLILCRGVGPWQGGELRSGVPSRSGANLVLCYEGRLTVDTSAGQLSLGPSELVVIPSHVDYRLSGAERALVLGLARPLPG